MGLARWRLAVLVAGLAFPAAAPAGEAYYLLMFGSQRVPANPNYSHSFATFVRVCWFGDGPCPPAPCLQAHTISWLPCNGVVRTLALLPECGHNFELHATIRHVQSTGQRVSLWGPYQIEPDLYARALRRIAQLQSGAILYKANDAGYRSDRVTNCIHAVSTIVEGPRLRVASPGWGDVASYAVLRRLRPWVIDPDCPHYWVSSALGLDAYPLIYRDRTSRRVFPVGPLLRLFGWERNLRATFGPPCDLSPR
jgi:hypothetical protein